MNLLSLESDICLGYDIGYSYPPTFLFLSSEKITLPEENVPEHM